MIAGLTPLRKFSFFDDGDALHFLQLAGPPVGPNWKALIRARKSLISGSEPPLIQPQD